MSKFLTPLVVEELAEDRWRLMVSLRYQSDIVGLVVVPNGFETDLESVPRWLPVAYAVLYGTAHAASTVHDWLYTTGQATRKLSDNVLYEAMIATGQPKWKSFIIWAGVRLGGRAAWNTHRRVEESGT